MVYLLSKLFVRQSRNFFTFHFKFKSNHFHSTRSTCLLNVNAKKRSEHQIVSRLCSINHESIFSSRKSSSNSFNIGQFGCKMSSNNPIIIEPGSKHQATLIFFHGLGDTGNGWSEYWQCLGVSGLKIILPTAPSNRVTLNMGMKMPSWFDILGLSEDSKEDEEGIKKAAEYVHNLINEEITKTNITSDKIILGGFSQGGALAIYSALTYPKKLAATVLYSCWLPLHTKISDSIQGPNKQLPTLQCHGTADVVVPMKWGIQTKDFLQTQVKNDQIVWKCYDGMGHSGCTEESKDTKKFLDEILQKLN